MVTGRFRGVPGGSGWVPGGSGEVLVGFRVVPSGFGRFRQVPGGFRVLHTYTPGKSPTSHLFACVAMFLMLIMPWSLN